MIKLNLIFTRTTIIPPIMCWYEGIGTYLEKTAGIGMIEHVLFLQNGVLKSYRSERQIQKVRDFMQANEDLIMSSMENYEKLYQKLESYGARIDEIISNPAILDNFYNDFLESWKPNFFALWGPEMLGKDKPEIMDLGNKVRARLDTFVFAYNFYRNLIGKIGKDQDLLSLCLNSELMKYLNGMLKDKERVKIMKRKSGWLVFKDKKVAVSSFLEAQEFMNQMGYELEVEQKIMSGIKELKGQVANKGKAVGKVKILSVYEDNKKVREGDILVSTMTTPIFIQAIRKSSAIITDEGGITCHAAIISRELGIPCIIGTKIATKVLRDGDLVKVDAERGVVKILKKS